MRNHFYHSVRAMLAVCLLYFCWLGLTACKFTPTASTHEMHTYSTPSAIQTTYPSESTEHNYVLNTGTRKFHRPDCYSIDLMNDENKAYYNGLRIDMLFEGSSPCGNCDP